MRRVLATTVVMHVLAAGAPLATSGCATYTMYAWSYRSESPDRDALAILAGVESAVGVATGAAYAIAHRGPAWYEDLAIGFLLPFVIDLAFALGVGTSDFVGEARDAQAPAQPAR